MVVNHITDRTLSCQTLYLTLSSAKAGKAKCYNVTNTIAQYNTTAIMTLA